MKVTAKDKPKGVTNKDLEEAIALEVADLLKEERLKILDRAKKRLAEKFGR